AVAASEQGYWWSMTGAAAVATAAVVLSMTPLVARLWLATPAAVATGVLAMTAAGLDARWQATVIAVGGALALAGASSQVPHALHVASLGLIAAVSGTTVALAVGGLSGTQTTACLGGVWLSLVVVAARIERSHDPFTEQVAALTGTHEQLAGWAALLVLLGAPVTAVSALDTFGGLDALVWRAALVIGVVGLVEASGARWLPERRQLLAVDVGTLAVLASVPLTADAAWPRAATLAAVMALVAIVPRRRQRVWTPWLAWIASAGLVMQLSERAGLPDAQLHRPLAVWGAVALLGAFGADRLLEGRRAQPGWVRRDWLQAPAALGSLACIASLTACAADTRTGAGVMVLGLGAVAAALTVLTAAGWLGGVAAAMATVGAALVAPFDPLDHTWTFVAAGGLLAGVAFALDKVPRPHRVMRFDDLAVLGVGVATALLGVASAPSVDQLVATWLAAAALSLAIGTWRHELPWFVAAIGLADMAAADAGPGWLTLALAVTTACVGTAAARSENRQLRLALMVSSAGLAAGTWVSAGVWLEMSGSSAALATGAACAALAVGVAALLRRGSLAVDWSSVVLGLATLGVATTATYGSEAAELAEVAWAAAIGLAGLALAYGIVAEPLRLPAMRYASVGAGLFAAAEVWNALRPSDVWIVAVSVAGSVAATVAGLWLFEHRRAGPWLWPVATVALAGTVVALGVSLAALPRRDLLVAALVATAMQTAAAGLVTGTLALQLAPAPLLAATWLTAFGDALGGYELWHGVPLGLALLAETAIARRDSATRGVGGTPAGFAAVELAGMAFITTPPVVEMIRGHLLAALVAIALGAGLTAWGIATKVRRRAGFGALTVLVGVGLLLALPLTRGRRAGPTDLTGSAWFWLAIIAVGAIILLVAVALEQGAARARRAVERLRTLTAGWE
ncbi:MAG TPA: hypothetical protein VF855_13755, partial [Acidimicrobiales bacterium]